jgi:hypothetical protein
VIYRIPDGGEHEEYTKFARAHTPFVDYVPLEIAPNRVRFYALSVLVEVVDPRLTGMVYGCAEPPRTLAIWRPTLTVTPEELWKPKQRGGIKLVECAHVNVVIQLEAVA